MNKKPKAVHITTVAMSLNLLLHNQLQSLRASDFEVCTISSPGAEVADIKKMGVIHFNVPMTRRITPVKDLISLWKLFRLMRHEQFDIVHTHNPKPGLIGQLAARAAGVPIVVNTVHGFYFVNYKNRLAHKFFIFLEKISAHCSDLIWSQNKEDISMALDKGICLPEKIKYLGNGIDLEKFNPGNISSHTIQQKKASFQLPAASLIVGFVGRLVGEKGLHELLEAAKIVLQKQKDVFFLIVGPTDADKPDAITPVVVQKYGIADHCVFTGMRQDMPELYALMDVFVLPSHREGLPRSPIEAMAMTVPCIVTDIRGCREVVIDDLNGLLVPPRDVAQLADAILYILNNVEIARRMGIAGRQLAEKHFDERFVFAKVSAEYLRLLKEKGLMTPDQVQTMTSHLPS